MPDVVFESSHAARRLRRAPLFAFTTIIVLALGIGAATAVFTIVDGVLVRPLPFPNSGQLFDLSHSSSIPGISQLDQSDGLVLTYQSHATTFTGIGAYREAAATVGAVEGASTDAERITGAGVTANLFSVLGVVPSRGRAFVADDDRRDAPPVALISEDLWQRKFGGDASMVGKRVMVDGKLTEIVGIMPARFAFPATDTKIWRPMQFDRAHASVGSFNYKGIGRLKVGVSPASATSELERILPRVLDEVPSDVPRGMWEQAKLRPVMTPLRDTIVGDVSRLLWILLGAVGLVLFISCANVANLFLVRAEGRQRELAVRSALGASRSVVVSQYLAESVIVAVVGGAIGIVLAYVGVRALTSLPAGIDLPRLNEVGVDGSALLFALAITALATTIVSVVPMLRTRHLRISSVLRESDRAATTGAARQRARGLFVILQVAMALVLVAGSGLMARSFSRLRSVNPGFDPHGVFTVRVAFAGSRYAGVAERMRYVDDALAKLAALPGVRSVGVSDWLPLTGDNNNSVVEIEDQPLPKNVLPAVHENTRITPGYFAAMGMPMLSGRTIGTIDASRPPLEVVVTKSFAERYWKSQRPLGKRLRPDIDGPWFTVVGVVGDSHLAALEKPAEEAIFLPSIESEKDSSYMSSLAVFVVRVDGDVAAIGGPVRNALRSVDPSLPTYSERTLAAIVDAATARTRFIMLLLGIASGIALLLGAVGIYGVMAYGVSLRRREIGVRLALGAQPSDVSWMISRQGLALAAVGVVAGLVAAIGMTRVLRGILYDVSPNDPLTFASSSVGLLAVALLASWIPSRRAAAVDPAESLRAE